MIRSLFPLFINSTESLRERPSADVGSAVPAFGGHMVLEMVGALMLVLLVIVALAWLLRGMQRMSGNWRSDLRVVGQIPLGSRERAVVVEVGDEQFLLGVGPGQVRLLCRLDQPLADPSPDASASPPFKALLRRFQKGEGERS